MLLRESINESAELLILLTFIGVSFIFINSLVLELNVICSSKIIIFHIFHNL